MTVTATKERPILFSGAMVRAILEGRKTQTRRVIKPQPAAVWTEARMENGVACFGAPHVKGISVLPCPYGTTGDRLWVRETWAVWGQFRDGPGYCYRADGNQHGVTWKPSIHMARRVSRITLEVTGVRVERIQDISEADAQREGWDLSNLDPMQTYDPVSMRKAREWFAGLWDHINGPRGYGWQANPWVWVVEFRRVEQP